MRLALPRVVIGGLGGGCGKTLVAVGAVRALRERGLRVVPFKKGPDFIDAAWLSRAAGIPCRNLDSYLMGEPGVMATVAAHGGGVPLRRRPHGAPAGSEGPQPGGLAIVEGARGLFDAMDEGGSTSTARLAKLLACPIVLVVDCTKVTRTVAAMVYGCQRLDRRLRIAGVILNRVGNPRHEANVRSAVTAVCGLPVLGALPRMAEAALPERHLGLVMPDEHDAAEDAIATIARVVARHVDLDALAAIARTAATLTAPAPPPAEPAERASGSRAVTVGVVRDNAFSFYYPENLEALQACGAQLVPVSATKDRALPELDALYIGGGFPETNAGRLEANPGFAASLRAAVEDGLPVYAECGGAVYVGRSLRVGEATWPMAGILPLDFVLHERPQGHGYSLLEATEHNPFFPAGARLRGHEFHYTAVAAWPAGGLPVGFRVQRGRGFDGAGDGVCHKSLMAVYSHVHAAGAPEWAVGIVRRAVAFSDARAARRAGSGRAAAPAGAGGTALLARNNALEGA